MRISTQNFYSGSGARLSEMQAKVGQTMQQVASGNKFLTPAQDPAAAVRTLEVTQSMSAREQLGKNRESVRSSLKRDKSQKTCSRILKFAISNLVALLFSNHALHGFAHMGELGGVVLGRGLQLALQLFQRRTGL